MDHHPPSTTPIPNLASKFQFNKTSYKIERCQLQRIKNRKISEDFSCLHIAPTFQIERESNIQQRLVPDTDTRGYIQRPHDSISITKKTIMKCNEKT